MPALKAVASQHLSLEVLSQAQQHCGSALLETPNAMVTLSHSRSAQLPNSKLPPLLSKYEVPPLEAIASQNLTVDVLSQAQQHWGSALLETPNALVTLSRSLS